MTLRQLAPLLVVLTAACTPYAASPAIRSLPLETVATVRAEHAAVAVAGGAHGGWGEMGTASGRVRYGLVDDVELQVEGAWAYSPDLERDRPISGHIGVGRIGLKHAPLEWLAFTAGFGTGAGPWGAYGGGDLGAIFAYENPEIVPFLALRMQLTGAFDPQAEPYTTSNGSGGTMTTFLTPATMLWFQPSTGFRIPICGDCDGVRGSFTGAFAWTMTYALEENRSNGALGGEIGFEIEL